MNSQEIDKIFEAFVNGDLEYIWNSSEMEIPYQGTNLEETWEKYENEILIKLIQKIEKGDFEYFLSRDIKNETVHSIYISLLKNSSNKEAIKECIDEKEGINKSDIVELIIAVNEPEYTKNWIKRKDEYLFTSDQIVELINQVNDVEYTRECMQKKEEFNFSRKNILELINAANNKEFTKECIEKANEYDILEMHVVEFINGLNNPEYAKECIENSEKYDFSPSSIADLVNGIGDPEYAKEFIEKRDEYDFSSSHITTLLKGINDPEYTKQFIENREEYGFYHYELKDLINIVHDPQYTHHFVENREEYGFFKYEVVELMRNMADPRYTKEYIERRDEFELSPIDIAGLITALNGPEYTLECIKRRKEYGLVTAEIILLAKTFEDSRYTEEAINAVLSDANIDSSNEIDLPTDMTIGIEIESIGEHESLLREMQEVLFIDWSCKSDSSLDGERDGETGVEIVSPILTGSNDKTTQSIRRVGAILTELGQYTNDTCGGHIHIGANYLTSAQAWQNLIELWSNMEMSLYTISNEEGQLPREGVNQYAMPISKSLEQSLSEGSINLSNEMDIKDLKDNLVAFQKNRYKGINFMNLKEGGKGTIEFRLPNGTVNPNTWIANVNLYGGIVQKSQELSIIQNKTVAERTEEDKRKLYLFEKISDEECSDRKKLDYFLELVIPEEKRDIYRKRYDVNAEKLEEDRMFEDQIKENISHKPIKLSKYNIAKSVLSGEDRITGEEARIAERIINRDIEQQRNQNEIGE